MSLFRLHILWKSIYLKTFFAIILDLQPNPSRAKFSNYEYRFLWRQSWIFYLLSFFSNFSFVFWLLDFSTFFSLFLLVYPEFLNPINLSKLLKVKGWRHTHFLLVNKLPIFKSFHFFNYLFVSCYTIKGMHLLHWLVFSKSLICLYSVCQGFWPNLCKKKQDDKGHFWPLLNMQGSCKKISLIPQSASRI